MRSGSFSTIAVFLRNDPGFADVQNIFYTSIQLAKVVFALFILVG